MRQNIIICYLLSFLRTAWFWLGIWVFYYLRLTDYAGIGLIETVMIATMTLFEVPTGAVADMIGRRNTLIFAFLFMAVGQIYMGFTPDLLGLLVAIVIGNVGFTLYSGTTEALAYDSLKEIGEESRYNKVIGNLNSIQLLAMTVCGAIGGYFYTLDPKLPFIAHGIALFVGFFISFLIVEPRIDSDKFSFRNYFVQLTSGFKQLFKTPSLITQTVLLVIVGSVMTVSDEMVDSILGVEFGFNPVLLGIFTSVVFATAAIVSYYSDRLKLEKHRDLIILGLFIALTYLVSPWAGLFFGGLSLIVRNALRIFFINTSSVLINNSVESKYRATTISTFNMLKNIPYVFTAYGVGTLMNSLTARGFSMYLGIFLAILLVLFALAKQSKRGLFRG